MGTDARLGNPGISRESVPINAESPVSGTRARESPSEEELVGSPRNRDDGGAVPYPRSVVPMRIGCIAGGPAWDRRPDARAC